jgi:hypothetical protein
MKSMTSVFTRKVLALGLGPIVAYAGLSACTKDVATYVDEPIADDAGFDTRPSADSGRGVLTFMPSKAYSGFDGTHSFTVPVAVYDAADDLDVSVTDPASADIVKTTLVNPLRSDGTTDNGRYYLVSVKKAGTVTLVAKSGGKSTEMTITAASYAAGRWEAGETRYKNGGEGDPPCTNCHVNGQAVDHSPAALGGATDEQVEIVITTGISLSGFPIQINGAPGHTWHVTDTERDGLVTYLRGLTPRGFK